MAPRHLVMLEHVKLTISCLKFDVLKYLVPELSEKVKIKVGECFRLERCL